MLKKYIEKWSMKGQEDMMTPQEEKMIFELKYKKLLIGTLTLEKGVWRFQYADEFKKQDTIKPLPDFPNMGKVYESKALYPFFIQRIPSPKQPKVQKAIKKNKIDDTNIAALLKFFGYQSIANPFLLSPV